MDALSQTPWEPALQQPGLEFEPESFNSAKLQQAVASLLHEMPISLKGINMPDIDPETLSDIHNVQMQDRLGNVLQWHMNGLGLPVNDKLKVAVQVMMPYCEQFDGIIYYRELMEENYRIYVPENLREELLNLHHGGKWGGHFGFRKTVLRMCNQYYWPRMHTNIFNACRSCRVCAMHSGHGFSLPVEIQSEHPPKELWYCLNMDILGISKMSSSGNKYMLVIIDKLTRFCILEAMPNQEAEMVLKKFVANMLQMGFPHHVFMDRGTQFTLHLAEGLAKTFGMNRVYTSKFNPCSDGQTENLN